jgi:hypothetical protein
MPNSDSDPLTGASGPLPSQDAPVSLGCIVAAAAASHRGLMLRRGSILEGAVLHHRIATYQAKELHVTLIINWRPTLIMKWRRLMQLMI